MATFAYKARKTTPVTEGTVDDASREAAIAQIIATAQPGEEIEVMNVTEVVSDVAPPEGPTGTSRAGQTTQAHLNDMSKDELLAEAARMGVEVNQHMTKADIVYAIEHR